MAQLLQLDDPMLDWYIPAAHAVQLVAAVTEYLPDEQLVQAVLVVVAEYFPAAHVEDALGAGVGDAAPLHTPLNLPCNKAGHACKYRPS